VPVPVIADGHWMPAPSVFVTQSDQLAEALSPEGMARWTAPGAELIPRLVAWVGMLDVDRSSKVEVLPSDTSMDGDVEARLHQAIASIPSTTSGGKCRQGSAARHGPFRSLVE